MPRLFKIGLGVVGLAVLMGGGVGFALSRHQAAPTLAVTLAVSPEPTETLPPTFTPTASPTLTLTPTATDTPSLTATSTPTLSTLVVQVTAVNPDVKLDVPQTATPTLTPSPPPTSVVPTPNGHLNPVPMADAAPIVGWLRYPADNAAVQRTGAWAIYTYTYRAAPYHYLYTNESHATLTLRFLGAAARVWYARLSSYGMFEVEIDGQVVSTVDAYLPKVARYGDVATTDVLALANGWHTLSIQRLDRRNPASTNGFVAIEGIDLFQNGAVPTAAPTATPVSPTVTPSPAPVHKLQVLVAPPTIPPTVTLAPPQVTGVSLTVAYDLNGDKAIEPGKGVADLLVQLVAADTNQIVASGNTDAQGYLHLETTGTAPLRLVIPYFNRFWDVPPHSTSTHITLLLPPANRPALIP